jgi:hypothetical protein
LTSENGGIQRFRRFFISVTARDRHAGDAGSCDDRLAVVIR